MILPLPAPKCAHPLADIGPLLCDREPGHDGAHVYLASAGDNTKASEGVDQ